MWAYSKPDKEKPFKVDIPVILTPCFGDIDPSLQFGFKEQKA